MTFQKRTGRRATTLLLVVAAGFVMFSGTAAAQDDTTERQKFEDTIHVVQKKPVLERGRVELAPRFGMSVNDSVYRSFKAGIAAKYHITERIFVGGMFDWFDFNESLGGPTEVFRDSYAGTRTAADSPVPSWFAAGEFGYQPIYGKFAIFNSFILYYDIGVSLGAGWIRAGSISTSEVEGSLAGTASLQSRLFINDWMSFGLELRDVVYQASLQGGAVQPIANLVTVSAGVSFYIPPAFSYTNLGSGTTGGGAGGSNGDGSSGGGSDDGGSNEDGSQQGGGGSNNGGS